MNSIAQEARFRQRVVKFFAEKRRNGSVKTISHEPTGDIQLDKTL